MKMRYLKRYIISSYILVWVLILLVAGTASLVFHASPVVMWIVRNLIAWSPTYLLLLGWKYFRPVLYRPGGNAPAAQPAFIVHIGPNWRRTGLARFYAGGVS